MSGFVTICASKITMIFFLTTKEYFCAYACRQLPLFLGRVSVTDVTDSSFTGILLGVRSQQNTPVKSLAIIIFAKSKLRLTRSQFRVTFIFTGTLFRLED